MHKLINHEGGTSQLHNFLNHNVIFYLWTKFHAKQANLMKTYHLSLITVNIVTCNQHHWTKIQGKQTTNLIIAH